MTSPGAVGVPAALGLLALTEAAVPCPIPADVLMLLVGERAAAGAVPVWLAVVGLELAVVVGCGVVFFALRGPARALVHRLGPRVGLTEARVARSRGVFERHGSRAIAVGRATPGLRTLTMVTSAITGVSARRALFALIVGSSVFVQAHFALGYVAGPAALDLIDRAKPAAIVLLAVALVIGLALWIRRRGRGAGTAAWAEATCPACLVVGLLVAEESRGGERVVDIVDADQAQAAHVGS